MKKLVFAPMAFALMVAAPTFGQDREAPAAEAPNEQEAQTAMDDARGAEEEAEEPDPGDEVICRRERVTGSLTRVNRVCMTRDEWNGVADQSGEVHRGLVSGAPGSLKICDNPLDPRC